MKISEIKTNKKIWLIDSDRTVPLWFFVWFAFLLVTLGSLFAVAFGWSIQSTLKGSDRSGFLGEIAVEIARSPATAITAFKELTDYATGNYKDSQIRAPREVVDLTNFQEIPSANGIDVSGLLVRADMAAFSPGWRLLVGAFVVSGEIENAALLISPALQIVKVWILSETPIDGIDPRPKYRKFIHGVAFLDDASLVFAFDGGISLQRIDHCGERKWAVGGSFHHSVTVDDVGTSVWTFEGDTITQVSTTDGEIMRQISMQEIISKNPSIDILEIRRQHPTYNGTNRRNTAGKWMDSAFHLNDVDPLSTALADRYGDFDAGDLLVSARSLNLIFVVDPESLEIKWWRVGVAQRQHDPDWQPTGEITVFNNRMSRDYSEIIAMDTASFRRRTLFDGRSNNFYTRVRGKHQLTRTGHLLVTSPMQGRAFEVSPEGEIVLEFVNTKPGSNTTNYAISELKWLPPEAMKSDVYECAN